MSVKYILAEKADAKSNLITASQDDAKSSLAMADAKSMPMYIIDDVKSIYQEGK